MSNNSDVKWWKLIWEMLVVFLRLLAGLLCITFHKSRISSIPNRSFFPIRSHPHSLPHISPAPRIYNITVRISNLTSLPPLARLHIIAFGLRRPFQVTEYANVNEYKWIKLKIRSHYFHCSIHNSHSFAYRSARSNEKSINP